MIDEIDYAKIRKSLEKRGERKALEIKEKERQERLNRPSKPDKTIFISDQKRRELVKMHKELLIKRKELNESWRLAVAEGDDRETDALSVSILLIQDNEIEIRKIENLLLSTKETNNDQVKEIEIGSRITVKIKGEIKEIMLVDPVESDPMNNKFSVRSPLGKSLIGKRSGESTTFVTPRGEKIELRILKIIQ